MPTAPPPDCGCQAVLRAEAERLLQAAQAAERRGYKGNALWCYHAAFGCLRAWRVLRRAAR